MDIKKEPNQKVLKFPDGFFWGAATSSHQVECANKNDWTEWEKKNAERLASEAPKKYSKQQIEKFPEMLEPKNYISGQACDHYHRFREDFDLARKLNHNAYRFSIEWSRVEPEEGRFDKKEIEHYREVIRALRERGIEPFITLWHYTHPLWFSERGSWLSKKAKDSFLKYAEKIVSEFKNEVKYWITMNEPETVARESYLQAGRPPQKRSVFKAFRALKTMAETHNEAYKLIHKIAGDNVQVSFAESIVYFDTYNKWSHNLLVKYILNFWRNRQFLPRVINHCDFIGLQYYFHSRVRLNPFVSQWGFQFNENKNGVSDMGWEIYPEGIYHILKDLKKYNKPIIITENGLADADDSRRAEFIKGHLFWIHRAIEEGVDVRGYFYWSLLDNFEWQQGYWPRFGLIEVDYSAQGGSASGGKTLERKVRPSAKIYAEICRTNELKS